MRLLSNDLARYLRPVAFLVIWLPVCCAQAGEGTPRVETAIGEREIFLGESVMYQVRVLNSRQSSKPDTSALETSFRVEPAGDQSLNRSFMSIINGRTTRRETFGHDYRFRLTPRTSGRIPVPSPRVTIGGKVYRGRSLTLSVIAPKKQDWVAAEIDVKPKRAYPTQPFTVTLRVVMKPLPDGDQRQPVLALNRPPTLAVPWLRNPPKGVAPKGELKDAINPLLSRNNRGFALDGFTVTSNDPFFGGFSMFADRTTAVVLPKPRREKRVGLDGESHEFFVYELPVNYTAEKSGEATFGPALLKGMFVTGVRGRSYTGEKMVVVAPAATVNILNPQAKDAPEDYSGAIGMFSLKASASPTKLRVGDPLTLVLEVVPGPGSGSLDLVGAPSLGDREDFMRDFTIIDDKPVGEVKGDVKRFTYGLRPRKPGVRIPAITMSYFDPLAEVFKQASTEPIDLDVSAAPTVAGTDLVTGNRPALKKGEIRTVAGGLHQNVSDLSELRNERTDGRFFVVLPLALLVVYSLLNLFVNRYRQRSSDVAWQRKQGALKEARQAMEKAKTDLGQAPSLMRAALLGFVANLANLPSAGLTPRDAEQALSDLGAPEGTRKELQSMLESLEAMAYGGASAADIDALCRKGDALIVRTQKEARGR